MAPARPMEEPDALIGALVQLGGAGLDVRDAGSAVDDLGPGVVAVGLHRRGPRPPRPSERFDMLLTTEAGAPRPWVGLEPSAMDATVGALHAQAVRHPAACTLLAQLLRCSLDSTFEAALLAESLAFSTLLGSGGFRAWRAERPVRARGEDARPRVRMWEEGEGLHITLDRPERRNALDARMRDDLCEALDFALAHPDRPKVRLSGEGVNFCAGGDLDEFGTARDPGLAHLIRLARSPVRRLHELSDRLEARLQGACIGAGVEMPAAAGSVVARAGTSFRLPEVAMGLIPGAGGTATLPRRIGRRRTCYMALSGLEIDLGTALDWGLVDAVAA